MTKKFIVSLTEEEQKYLQGLIERRSEKSAVVKRAYALQAADINGPMKWPDSKISQVYGLRVRTIEKIRQRFVEDGFETVINGKPQLRFKDKIFDGKVEAHLVALRCSDPPEGNKCWTLQLLKEQMIALGYVESISHETIRQMLKKNQLKPWLQKCWVIPKAGSEFVCSMEEVLDYMNVNTMRIIRR
jgi:hypothetical protein